jgi:hypothetical protein
MVVTTSTAGFTIPPNTTIVSITNNAATLSNNITGSGQITLTAIGPSDTTAVDGGMIVKGTTDKKITWKGTDGGVTYNTWVSSENFDLASGKIFSLNGINIADPTAQVIGPTDGTGTDDVNLSGGGTAFTLGSAVLNSSLTSVGTLTSLSVDGTTAVGSPPSNNLLGKLTIFEGTDFNTASQPGLSDNIYLISDQTSAENGYGASIAFSRIQYSDRRAAAIVTKQTTADEDQVGLAFFTHSSTNAADNIVESLVVTHDGDVLPGADATQDLGSSSKRWANIYSADLQLSNEGAANEVDGTWGQYTIQEGEDDLFLINRRSGKKYKFMLQEVN